MNLSRFSFWVTAMCFTDLLERLRSAGVSATESQIRWAIKAGYVSRPRRDGSLRFVFTEGNVSELVEHFSKSRLALQPEAALR